MKTLAKSLHTVTVLVRVAELFYKPGDKAWNAEDAVASAMKALGYPDDETLDPYGLAAAALKQLSS